MPWNTWKKPPSAPSIPSAHSFCASGPWRRASIRPSRNSASRKAGGCINGPFEHGLNAGSPSRRRDCGARSHDSPGAIPGTIPRPSSSCSTPAENSWSGATTPPHGAANRFARDEEIGTVLRMARELADLSSRPRRVTDNLYIGLQPVRLMVQGVAAHDPGFARGRGVETGPRPAPRYEKRLGRLRRRRGPGRPPEPPR